MGLLGGWWGVAAVGLVAAFLAREFYKCARGEVSLTARQKVVRPLGGILLLGIVLMIVYSPMALRPLAGASLVAQGARELIYWTICLGMSVMLLLMAVMDAGEITRQFVRDRKASLRGTLTREDVDRILRGDARDHPDDVGRGPE